MSSSGKDEKSSETINLSQNQNVIYLGSNISTGEGLRHYFLIKANNSKYTALNGKPVEYFGVYTSTGVNTKGICGKYTCLVPFFGIMTNWQRIFHTRDTILAPIIKTVHIQAIEYKTKNEPYKSRYENLKKLFLNGKNIDDKLLREYFNDPKGLIDIEEYKDLKEKLGSNEFLQDIIDHKAEIFEYLEKGNKIMYPDLTFLNKKLGTNNYFGIDLSKIPNYYDIIQIYKNRKPDFLLKTQLDEKTFKEYDNTIAETLKKNKEISPDKYNNMIYSPLEYVIYKEMMR